MNEEANSHFSVHRSELRSCVLAAALLDELFEHPAVILPPAPYGMFWPCFPYQSSFSAAC